MEERDTELEAVLLNNGTFFEASNGWQFKITDKGHIMYKFREELEMHWTHMGQQFARGFIEWAQSEVWQEEENDN